MAAFSIPAPRLAGLLGVVPTTTERNEDLASVFGEDAIRSIIRSTGIEQRPVAQGLTIAEMGAAGVQQLLQGLRWEASSVQLLIVVTQTPDHPMPGTAHLIHGRCGLPKSAVTLDLNMGCSGFVYALSIAFSLMHSAQVQRALVVCGDVSSSMIDPTDRALRPIFGDGVAVAALEKQDGARLASFDLGSDGSGACRLMSHTGGTRAAGTPRMQMDGLKVLTFALEEVPASVQRTLAQAESELADVDGFVFHQANALILRALAKKIGICEDRVLNALRHLGNTSSASIPLALCSAQDLPFAHPSPRLLMSGFGVGWSFASVLWQIELPAVRQVMTIPC